MLPARRASAAVAALAFASGLVAVLSTGSAGTMQDRAVTALPPEVSVAVRPMDAPPAEVPAAILTSVRSAGEETDAEPATRLPSTDSLITLNAHPTRPQYPDAPCMIRTSAKPQSGAAVRLQASATCLPESRVTVHHGGMLFTELTDADGTIDIVVPALAERAVFMLTFEGEQMAMAVTRVPDLPDIIASSSNGKAMPDLHSPRADPAPGSIRPGLVASSFVLATRHPPCRCRQRSSAAG